MRGPLPAVEGVLVAAGDLLYLDVVVKSGCVPLHWQHCRVSVSMSVLLARGRARAGYSFQIVRRHHSYGVALSWKEAAGAEEALIG